MRYRKRRGAANDSWPNAETACERSRGQPAKHRTDAVARDDDPDHCRLESELAHHEQRLDGRKNGREEVVGAKRHRQWAQQASPEHEVEALVNLPPDAAPGALRGYQLRSADKEQAC